MICAKMEGRVILTISLPMDSVAMRSSRVIVFVVILMPVFLFPLSGPPVILLAWNRKCNRLLLSL